jgi:hypothetical protein
MRTLLAILLVFSGNLSLLGCKIAEEKVFGRYRWWPHHDLGIIAKLDSSHRFKLLQVKGNVLKRGEGNWHIKGQKLILQSDSGQHAHFFIRFDQAIWKAKVKKDSVVGVHNGRVLLKRIKEE